MYRATATDAVGNTSPCSGPIAYVEDSTAPAPPAPIASNPASPADDNSPRIRGSAESDSTVRLYATGTCAGPVTSSGGASELGTAGLSVNVVDDTATSFSATATDAAGNTSGCSARTLTFVESSISRPTATMTIENKHGTPYIALPRVERSMTVTFKIGALPPTHGPIALALSIGALKMKTKDIPSGVKLASNGNTAIWTIATPQSGTSVVLKGTTKVSKHKAVFGIGPQGTNVAFEPVERTLRMATRTITLRAAGGSGRPRTLVGTVAASTCDQEGTGKLRLRIELAQSRGSAYVRLHGPRGTVHLDKPSLLTGVCTFRVPTGVTKELSRGLRLRYQIVSSNGKRSGKLRVTLR
jgi:hypothetical protein